MQNRTRHRPIPSRIFATFQRSWPHSLSWCERTKSCCAIIQVNIRGYIGDRYGTDTTDSGCFYCNYIKLRCSRTLPRVLNKFEIPHLVPPTSEHLNTWTFVSCLEQERVRPFGLRSKRKGAITSKIKHAIKLKTSTANLAQLLHNCCSPH